MDDKYVNVKVSYTIEKENEIEALHCYVTQYTAKEVKKEEANKFNDISNTIHFRKYAITKGLKHDLQMAYDFAKSLRSWRIVEYVPNST